MSCHMTAIQKEKSNCVCVCGGWNEKEMETERVDFKKIMECYRFDRRTRFNGKLTTASGFPWVSRFA